MNSYENAQAQSNFGEGNVVEHFKKMRNLIAVNDGLREFTPRTVTCHDQQAPFWENEQTYLSITHKDHHVSHISDGFIHMNVEFMLQLTGYQTNLNPDIYRLVKIFVGFKDSNQVFKQMWIRTRNHGTGYEQSEMCREGFCMGQSMDFNSKKSRKYVHTLYESISNFNESVCGVFIDAFDFRDGNAHPVVIELVIPFDDLAALQAFAFYPNAVVGDLELNFYVGSAGLVYAPIDPHVTYDVLQTLQGIEIDTTLSDAPINITHQFSQINNPTTGISNWHYDQPSQSFQPSTGPIRLSCVSMRVLSCEANMAGFKVRESTLKGITEIFTTPVNIPAEYLEYNAFPTPPDESGLRSTLNTMLNNVKDIYIMFPKRANDITCFDNPCIDQFCIRCLGIQYPDKVISTLGARFYQYMITAADIGGHLRPTDEFVDSYTMVKNNSAGDRYANTLRDGSSFALIIQTERNESGYVFDGIDSNGQSTPIDIQFAPMFKGAQDTYYNFDPTSPTLHPPAPQLWLCRDVYWTCDVKEGLVFHKYGIPDDLEIDK
jgi:hypothetical protein